jgi:multiple sugar transport system substrate-binding protein
MSPGLRLFGRRQLLAGGLCALLTARAGVLNARSPKQAGALEVMGNPYNEPTYRALAKSFEASTPGERVSVSFSPREGDEIVRALLLRAFTGAALPDVVFLNGDVIRTFAERELLAALDPLMKGEGIGQMRAVRVGPVARGILFGLSVPVVAFNSHLVRRSGHDPGNLPRDWKSLLALARRIDATVPGATGGFIEHDNGGAFTFQYLLESFGGKPMSADETRLAFDSSAGLQAMHVLCEFGEAGQADADMSRRQARRAFASGSIGVLVTMSSVIPYLGKTSAGAFDIKVAPLPLANAHARVPAAGPVGVVFAKDPERQHRAWRFLRYAAGPEGQSILVSTSGYLPAGYAPAAALPPSRRLSLLVQPERVTPWYTFPGRNSLKISELIQDQMQQVATLQTPPDAALGDMVRSVGRLLARR